MVHALAYELATLLPLCPLFSCLPFTFPPFPRRSLPSVVSQTSFHPHIRRLSPRANIQTPSHPLHPPHPSIYFYGHTRMFTMFFLSFSSARTPGVCFPSLFSVPFLRHLPTPSNAIVCLAHDVSPLVSLFVSPFFFPSCKYVHTRRAHTSPLSGVLVHEEGGSVSLAACNGPWTIDGHNCSSQPSCPSMPIVTIVTHFTHCSFHFIFTLVDCVPAPDKCPSVFAAAEQGPWGVDLPKKAMEKGNGQRRCATRDEGSWTLSTVHPPFPLSFSPPLCLPAPGQDKPMVERQRDGSSQLT